MCRIKKSKTPKELNNFIEKIQPGKACEEICKERTLDCLRWYSRKAIFYKRFFFFLSIINIAAPLISTYLLSYQEPPFPGAVLSALTAFSASMLALFNVRDKWVTYRSASEYLKSQYTQYCAKTPPYDKEDACIVYLNNIESYMTFVHAHWCNSHKQESSSQNLQNRL